VEVQLLLVVAVDSFFRSRSTTRVSLSSFRQVDGWPTDSVVEAGSDAAGDCAGCSSGALGTNVSCLRFGVSRF